MSQTSEKPKKRRKPKVEADHSDLPITEDPVVRPLVPPRLGFPLAVLCGLLYFLAFPGVDLWPLSFVALVPLIVALRGQPPKRALWLGWTAGFTMTMVGFYWLLGTIEVFGGFPKPLAAIFMAVLCGYQAGRIALCGWLYGRAEQRGWPAAPVFALAFVASERVFPLLFPWYYGATVHNAPVLLQLADLGGPYLVGLVLVAVNLALAELIVARIEARRPSVRVLVAGALAPLVALAYGYPRLVSVDKAASAAEPVKLGIIQGNQPLMGRHDALRIHLLRTHQLKAMGADLVIWSEGAAGQVFWESQGEKDLQRRLTQRLGVPTITGVIMARKAEPRPVLFNSAVLSDERGTVLGRYDKQYLLAFGEYLPFGETFPVMYSWSPNSSRFSSGSSIEPLVWKGHRLSTLICYEDILPSFVNKVVRHADPDLLVNLTNDTWFGESTEPWIHMALSKLRAVEHRRYLVRATNTGVSAIVDPVGRVIAQAGMFREASLLGEARFMKTTTGYEIWGDLPWYAASLAIAWMAFRRRKQA